MLQNVNKHWRAHLEMLLEETIQSNCSPSGSVGDLSGAVRGPWRGCWGPSDVHWESVWSPSGVRQISVRSLSGVGQESVRSRSGVGQESVEPQMDLDRPLDIRSQFGELIKSALQIWLLI